MVQDKKRKLDSDVMAGGGAEHKVKVKGHQAKADLKLKDDASEVM